MACYFVVIRSTRLRDGQLRSIKGVFRGPIGARGAPREGKCSGLYCELCDKQYERQQQYDNHTSSYDHHHRQRLKDLKQREFYRQLRSRRRRRGREQWPRSPLQVKHSVSGLGPMFRNTTVALDTADEPTVLTGCTKEQVRSRSQWGSSDLSSLDTAAASVDHIINETARPPEAHRCVNCTVPSAAADDDRNGNTHTPPDPHTPSAHTHTRPVCFSLPKRNCTLLHQSAAVFLQPPTSKENETKTPPNVDRADVETSSDSNKQTDPISATLKPTQNERMDSQRPKEPFCRVLSRDGATLLLWPSEMVSYTRAAPSISFSVNPLLHDFKAENTNGEVSVDKSGGPGRGEGFVIKRAEREQRQEEAQGPGPGPGGGLRSAQRLRGGLGSAHEREHEDSHSAAAIFVAHCVSSSCDESALKCPLDCEFKGHREPRTKRRRGKRRNRKRRTNRAARISKKIRKLQANSVRMNQVNSQELRADLETPNLERPDLRDPKHRRKHQAASNDQKRAHLLSHLPVSHCNGGEQLCAQVNSQARRHLPLQSNSQRSPGFRRTPSGGAACNAAISLVPRADIETPRCPAITPCPASSRVDVCEPPAETQLRENHMLPENGAMRKELLGKRTFDKTFDLNTLRDQVQNVPVEPHTVPVVAPGADDPSPSPPLPQTHVHCDVFTPKKVKREKDTENFLGLICTRSDPNLQEAHAPREVNAVTRPTTQMSTNGRTKRNTGVHFVTHGSSGEVKQTGTTTSDRAAQNGSKRDPGECPSADSARDKRRDRCGLNETAKNEPTEHLTSVSTTVTGLISAKAHARQWDHTHHFTNCNYSEKDAGVVVVISAHPDQRRKPEREIRKKPTREGEWAGLPLPLPPLYLPLPPPLYLPLTPVPAHFSPHPSPLPPLPPPAFYASAPVPPLQRPAYPLPAALYAPPPPPPSSSASAAIFTDAADSFKGNFPLLD